MADKKPKLTKLDRPKKCLTCGKTFDKYTWGCFWCLSCDKKRVAKAVREIEAIKKERDK